MVCRVFATAVGLSLGFGVGLATTHAQPVKYQLIQGSTVWARPDAGKPTRAQGSFALTPRAGPLDWDLYEISDVYFLVANDEEQPQVVRGSGVFRRSARSQSQRMELAVAYRGAAFQLDSGEVAWDLSEPDLDLALEARTRTGGEGSQLRLRLRALPELQRWHYRLLHGSQLLDDCSGCGRAPILTPVRGEFDLVLVSENLLFSRYHLFNVSFTGALDYHLSGEGEYQVGGEVAVIQRLELELEVIDPSGIPRTAAFQNSPGPPGRGWPMLAVDVTETKGTDLSTLSLEWRAAPLREIWFSTRHGLTSGNHPPPDNRFSGADLMADDGRLVKAGTALTAALALSPDANNERIDALTVAPGGEVWFSFADQVTGAKLGTIGDGDLVSDQGRVVKRNAELLAPFGLQPPLTDLGLDGVQVLEDGEILFSLTGEAFSERLGAVLHPGDLLSNKGVVRHSFRELLARFKPTDPDRDPGLDAFHVWPSGEVWFSTEQGFDSALGSFLDGDLLSDQGYVVFRNWELVQAYAPLEDLANFGLDGLFLVTDAAPLAPPPTLLPLRWDPATENLQFRWQGRGRVFQLEQTPSLPLPFVAATPIVPAQEWTERIPPAAPSHRVYRLRQW